MERCILEALLRRVLYCGHSTQYSHLVSKLIYIYAKESSPNRRHR